MERTERYYPIGSAPRSVKVHGKRLYMDLQSHFAPRRSESLGEYPKKGQRTEGAGVHETQIEEATAYNKSVGLKTEYERSGEFAGCPIFENPKHEDRHLTAWNQRRR
jgi:hypothetical protein